MIKNYFIIKSKSKKNQIIYESPRSEVAMLKSSQNHDLMINDRYMRSFTFRSIDFIIKLEPTIMKAPESLKLLFSKLPKNHNLIYD